MNFWEKIIKIKSSEMAFPAFWDYVVISDPINCHKATSKRSRQTIMSNFIAAIAVE